MSVSSIIPPLCNLRALLVYVVEEGDVRAEIA